MEDYLRGKKSARDIRQSAVQVLFYVGAYECTRLNDIQIKVLFMLAPRAGSRTIAFIGFGERKAPTFLVLGANVSHSQADGIIWILPATRL
jgi:hypothetical protein